MKQLAAALVLAACSKAPPPPPPSGPAELPPITRTVPVDPAPSERPVVREERCGKVTATWTGTHTTDGRDGYDRFTTLSVAVAGGGKPWTQDLTDFDQSARTDANAFSPDCKHVLLLQSRTGPYHVVATARFAAYVAGGKPDYVLDGEHYPIPDEPGSTTGAGVFRDGGWLSSREVAYTWGCCDPPITTNFVLP